MNVIGKERKVVMYQYAEECVFFSAVAQVSADQPEIALSGIVIEGSFSEFCMYVSGISYGAAFAEEMALSDGASHSYAYSRIQQWVNSQKTAFWSLAYQTSERHTMLGSERCG